MKKMKSCDKKKMLGKELKKHEREDDMRFAKLAKKKKKK